MILESVENGPLLWPTVEENKVTRPKKYSELSATEAIQADCDVKANSPRTSTRGKQRVIFCYNCKGEGHMSKQCTKPKRKRDEAWFKDKVLLVQAQANGQVLYEKELDFLADPGIAETQSTQPNGKLIHNSIINGPYVRRLIPEPEDPSREVPVNETFHVQTDVELTKKELKQIEADDQAIQTILLGLPEDIYAAVDSCETSQEIWYNDVQNVRNQVIQNAAQNPRVQNVGNQNGLIGVPGNANQNSNGNGNLVAARVEGNATGHNGNQIRCYNCRGVGYFARSCTVRPRRRDVVYLQTQLLSAQKEEAGIQLQAEEFDLMDAAVDLDEIEEVNANCILMANFQQASTSGTQTNKALVYDSDGSDEVHNYEVCYDNEIFNMFTQKEQYTELLKPIPESHKVPQNDNNVISEVTSMEQSGEIVEQHHANVEETRALYDSLYHNLAIEVEKVNTVNRKLKETNAELTTELTRFKNKKSVLKLVKKNMTNLKDVIKNENFPIVNQVDARVQNFEIQFLKEAAKFVGDFKSLAKEADESLAKHRALELEIKRLLRAVVSQDIMSVVQNNYVGETSNLQTELERTKERFKNCIIKKENEYAKLWNDWYKKCEECKFDKISYDKAYNDIQQKIEWLQAQLGDLNGKSKDTSFVSDTLNPLSQKLENENVELEF
uniref:Ribonuclease H-like domain-containing protein n=1 Tax=Tanacetum cinerariifolium TaxID=118510 RepID=A0A6L2KJ62_TANCI|nr:ribonuclease H-like domain-containing protein [Tanacetum cinerariifolium]